MRAYDEIYLDDAMNNLGDMLDYAVNDCGYNGDEFFTYFIFSGVASSFEIGNPKYVAGLSGPEIASEVIYRTYRTRLSTPVSEGYDKTAEYWAGWALAYYQWHSSRRFADMRRNGLTIERMLELYPTLHEADISKFIAVADHIINTNYASGPVNLQRIRKENGLTQKALAEKSGVSLRMIQLYEQRKKEINKAQAISVSRLARALYCDIADLLE